MAGSIFKRSELQRFLGHFAPRIGIFILASGCASTPSERVTPLNDAPHIFKSGAQAAWNAQGFAASPDYHFSLGEAYAHEGKVDRAIEEYRAALAYDPNSSLLHSRLSAEYLKKGNTSFAIEECKHAIELEPKSADLHLMLGGIYSVTNQTDLALEEYDLVLRLQPTNDEAAVFKTQALAEKNRFDDALKFIRAFTAKVKDSAAAWFYAGKLEFAKNNLTAAIRDYRTALELRPGFTQATLALGIIFETHSENSKAKEIYEAQLEEKQDMQVAGRLATLYLKANQLDAGLKVLNVMRVLDPEDLNTQLKIGLIYLQKQDWKRSRETFEDLLKKVPDSDRVHYYLAAVLEEQNLLPGAIEHLLKVATDSKLFEDANLHASALYRKLQNKSKSIDTILDAIHRAPENAGFYLVLASLYEDEKSFSKSLSALESGLKIFPDHEKMRYFHGALLDKVGKQDEAIEEMELVIKHNPENADALNYIGYTWTTQGVHLGDAERMLRKALKLKPDSPFILDSIGWNQFVQGKNKDALIYLEKAVSLKSDESAILEHLVEVYSRNQMLERAQATKVKLQKLEKSGRFPSSVEEDTDHE